MNILHICTFPWGGAFNGTYRLHLSLLAKGLNSKILVNYKPSNPLLKEVYYYNEKFRTPTLYNKILNKLGFPIIAKHKKLKLSRLSFNEYEIITLPFSDTDITKSVLYHEADLIHLHWVADFIDFGTFFKKNKKPIILTLRDLWPLRGIFHYDEDRITNRENVLGKIDLRVEAYKAKVFNNVPSHRMIVVGLSNWISNESMKSRSLNKFTHFTIPNCLNIDGYNLFDVAIAKQRLGVDKDRIVLTFASDNIYNKRKGFDILLKALNLLPHNLNIELHIFGSADLNFLEINYPYVYHGHLDIPDIINLFSASDAFIFPTREEALGNVMLEAMACGVPVIGFKIGGLKDVIVHGFNGLFADNVSHSSLAFTIQHFIENRKIFERDKIQMHIKENYSENIISNKYIKVYKSLLK